MRLAREVWFWLTVFCLSVASTLSAADEAKDLFDSGKFEEARAVFLKQLEKNPLDPEALYYLGKLSYEAPRAKAFFKKLIDSHPGHDLADDAAFELAEAVFAGPDGLYLSARKLYQDFTSTYVNSSLVPQALYRTGLTFLALEEADSASVYFKQVFVRFSEAEISPYAKLGMVDASVMSGKMKEAVRLAESLESEAPIALRELVKERLTEVRASTPSSGAMGGFWVRVGAFGRLENARKLAARLVEEGFQVRESMLAGGALMLLEVGPYAKREEAEKAKTRIEKTHDLTCKVREQA